MGKRGPPPKPSALKKLQGTFRPDRAARNELIAPTEAPPRPKLSKIAGAKWDELVALLLERGTISREDGVALEQFCRFYAQWLKYEAEAEREPIIETPFGVKNNPAAEMALKLEQRLTALGDRLGLTASARSKVSVPEKKKPDEDQTENFLFKPRLVKPA